MVRKRWCSPATLNHDGHQHSWRSLPDNSKTQTHYSYLDHMIELSDAPTLRCDVEKGVMSRQDIGIGLVKTFLSLWWNLGLVVHIKKERGSFVAWMNNCAKVTHPPANVQKYPADTLYCKYCGIYHISPTHTSRKVLLPFNQVKVPDMLG